MKRVAAFLVAVIPQGMSGACFLILFATAAFAPLASAMVREVVTASVPFSKDGSATVAFRVSPLPKGPFIEVRTAWNDEGLVVETDGSGTFNLSIEGENLSAHGMLGERTLIPWSRLRSDGNAPKTTVKAIWDISWDGISASDVAALSQRESVDRKSNTHYRNTSMSVLCAKPQFHAQPHLQGKDQWGEMVFGGESCSVTHTCSDGLVRDFTELAVPRGNAVVDGSLEEWNCAAFSRFALLPCALGERYSGEVAARFDDEALYLAVRICKPQGIPENSARFESHAGYLGGDAFQIRLAGDDGRSESFCAWFDSFSGRPALTSDNKNHPADSVFSAGGALVFGKWSLGYSMELKLPWAAIGVKPPKDGERRRATFQPWWGPVCGSVTIVADLSLAARPVKALALDLPREGRLAAGVFASDGSLVRQLCTGHFFPKGRAALDWDGRDQQGDIAPSGDYTLRGVLTGELRETYRFSLMNPGTPAWPTADGTGDWLSDEAPPQGVATDGERIFIAAPGAEKGTAILCLGSDDRRTWGYSARSMFPRCVSLSCADGKLYALFSGPRNSTGKSSRYDGKNAFGRAFVMCFDAKTGKLLDFSDSTPQTLLPDTWEYHEQASGIWSLAKTKTFSPKTYIGQPRYFCAGMGEPDNAIGLAALGGVLAVSKFFENRIDFYDRMTLEKRGSVAVKNPAGLCRIGDTTFLAVSGNCVVRIDLSRRGAGSAEAAEIVGEGLSAPVGVTVDGAGNIYVSDWAGEMCVKKFSATGKLLGVIGKRGGRAWIGEFDRLGMLLPHGLAVCGTSLYVAEADMIPKRVSKWNVTTGALERDWIGPGQYAGGTWLWLDSEDDSIVHLNGCSLKVDWDKGTWRVLGTDLRRMDDAQPFAMDGADVMASGSRVIRRNGVTFVALTKYKGPTTFYRKEGDRLVPCAALGSGNPAIIGVFDSDIGPHNYEGLNPDMTKGCKSVNWVWSDLNGNGCFDDGETQFVKAAGWPSYSPKNGEVPIWRFTWGTVPGPDGTLALFAATPTEAVYSRISPSKWTEFGPVFVLADETVFLREPLKRNEGVQGTYVDGSGNMYYAGKYAGNRSGGAPYALRSFASDGSLRWTMATPKGRTALSPSFSNLCAEWDVSGIGRVLGGWNWWWTLRPYLITDDGLVLATAFDETNDGPRAIWGESHQFFVERRGRRYVVNGGNQQAHFVELKGLENAERLESSFTMTEGDVKRALSDEGAWTAESALPNPRIVVSWRNDITVVDGSLDDWSDAPRVSIDGGKGRAARIALSRDGANLYVAADVDDPTPMLQEGDDWQTLFLTGDCVDVMLSGDDAKRRSPRECVPGDRRLEFSLFRGGPIAVLFEPVTEPRSKTPVQMMATSIDSVRRVESAKVAILRREDGSGYVLEAEVPLAEIGALPMRGDVGVIFSGSIGGRELRLYHFNRDTGMTDDLTTEATLQPHEWGELFVVSGPSLFTGAWQEKRGTKKGCASFETTSGTAIRFAAGRGASETNRAAVVAVRPFAVNGDATLDVSFLFRAKDLRGWSPSNKRQGVGSAEARLDFWFYGKEGKFLGSTEVAKFGESQSDWRRVRGRFRNGGSACPEPIVAPREAVRGVAVVSFFCTEPSFAPEVEIDNLQVITGQAR